jgi:subtilisin family serine protease
MAACEEAGLQCTSFWITNTVFAKNAPVDFIKKVMAEKKMDVKKVNGNKEYRVIDNVEGATMEEKFQIVDTTSERRRTQIAEYGIVLTEGELAQMAGFEGEGATVCSVDTGVRWTHEALVNTYRGDVENHDYNWYGPGSSNYPSAPADGNGHGTHVAGTVGGTTYGIAKNVELIEVKVLNRQGSGTTSGVVAGINYVANSHGSSRPSVGNMSLGGGRSTALNDAANACVNNGVHMAVASGNSNANACNFSPASAANVISVNSMDNQDRRSSFSNFGTCTHIFAPGTNVLSSWIGSNSATQTISGTSMAAPHVAGVVSVIAGTPGAPTTPAAMRSLIQSDGTQNVISNPGSGSPNTLIFNACVDN